MVHARVTERDDSLPHQIRLSMTGAHMTAVGCNCRPGVHLAVIDPREDPWPYYNNAQHNNSKEKFVVHAANSPESKVFDVK